MIQITKVVSTTFLAASLLISGCANESTSLDIENAKLLSSESHGVYYEIFVRSYADSDGNGIGDLKGAAGKLDYLKDLGIEGIWLMPIIPSPSYHGYDVTNYRDINPEYGTLDEMKAFVKEAHERGINVIIDLVVNHTSQDHAWFQKALTGDPKYKDYYVWATEDRNISATGEWGQKVWHEVGDNKYYEGVFWEGMPDLNFENPDVRNEMIDIGKFWLEKVGVDGFRLDAAKHIYSETSSEIDEENDQKWWREFRAEMEKVNSNVVLVGEVWDSATVVAPYLNDGLTSAFNFDLAGQILESVRSERDAGIVSSLTRIRDYFNNVSNGKYIDSTFITNHDMNRVMSELNGNIDQGKMAASLLLTLPGNPFIYYGEETGLFGTKPDEEIREPFLWTRDKNAAEQTKWEPLKHNQDFAILSVEAQLEDENSLLNHYKNMIHVRRSAKVLIEGEIKTSLTQEDGVLSFKRTADDSSMLVIHNLSGEEKEFTLSEIESEYSEVYYKTKQEAEVDKDGDKVQIKLPSYSSIILK
ncbi:MAG: alpha-amylase family glycosyl hydrolase [Bacillota bacterium]